MFSKTFRTVVKNKVLIALIAFSIVTAFGGGSLGVSYLFPEGPLDEVDKTIEAAEDAVKKLTPL